jgi:signal transduction histidine kinase/sugar phosphate isomerase/epimerase
MFDELGELDIKAETLSEIASSYQALNDLAIALEYSIKAMDYFIELGNKASISVVYNRIAIINMLLGETEEALEYYHKSIDLKRELGDKVNEGLSLMNIGLIYHDKEEYDEAIKYFNEALKLNKEINEKVNASLCLINIANALTKQDKFEESEKKLDEAKLIIDTEGDKYYKSHLYMAYAKVYTGKKEMYEAIQFINDAISIAEEIDSNEVMMECYMLYSECYAELTDYEKAHEYFKKYYDLKSEIFSKEMYEKIKNLQYKYERETALKEAETQKKRGEELEKALKKVEELNEDLRKINEEKNTFMALVAHDLKNPLNAVLGYAQLVKSNPEHFTEEEFKEMFNDIEISARIMTDLITNYLEFTTIEAGKVELDMKEVDFLKVAKYVIDAFSSRAKAKDISLEYDRAPGEIIINADKNALTQILDNLVSNAIKFSRSGKKVNLSIERIGNVARCVVKDEGPGVGEEEMGKLFKKFSRLSAKPTAGESSTGLGLSITKKLTEDMKGKVWCESSEGKGASFILEFPVL